jgi:hypothetical protein
LYERRVRAPAPTRRFRIHGGGAHSSVGILLPSAWSDDFPLQERFNCRTYLVFVLRARIDDPNAVLKLYA